MISYVFFIKVSLNNKTSIDYSKSFYMMHSTKEVGDHIDHMIRSEHLKEIPTIKIDDYDVTIVGYEMEPDALDLLRNELLDKGLIVYKQMKIPFTTMEDIFTILPDVYRIDYKDQRTDERIIFDYEDEDRNYIVNSIELQDDICTCYGCVENARTLYEEEEF